MPSMLDPNEQKMLEEALELAQENNNMLRKMRRAQAWATVWRVIYWAAIIGVFAASYYYLQPIIQDMLALYGALGESVGDLQAVGSQLKDAGSNIPDLGGLLEKFNQ